MNSQNEKAALCISECLTKTKDLNLSEKDFLKIINPICRSYGFRDFDQTMELAMVFFFTNANNTDFGWGSLYKKS